MIRTENGEPPAVHLARLMMKRAKRSSPRIAQENFLGEDCKDFLVVFSGPVFVLPLAVWGARSQIFSGAAPTKHWLNHPDALRAFHLSFYLKLVFRSCQLSLRKIVTPTPVRRLPIET